MDPAALAAMSVALLLGGILKGATGAGVPVVAVPVMAAFIDARTAVVVMAVANLITNLWQLWQFRGHHLPGGFTLRFAGAGALGAAAGTVALARLPAGVLSLAMAAVVLAYVGLRLARPGMRLPFAVAQRLSLPLGIGAGVLQGAVGISAPISVTMLNAMRLDRPEFIVTVSAFFAAMCLAQLPAQAALGLLTWPLLAAGLLALVPVLAGMPAGAWLARRMRREVFDRLILALLVAMALKLVFDGLAGG